MQKNGGINQYAKSVLFIANSSNHYYCSANHTIEKKFLKLLLSSSNSGVTGDGVGAAGAPSFASTSTSGHSVWVPMVYPNSLLFGK
uniref:Uncharacterized protein n=1 Tax=Glossina palpalis gambiensis TaxID=67801 RepID=A0A1B0BTF9_9MUSC